MVLHSRAESSRSAPADAPLRPSPRLSCPVPSIHCPSCVAFVESSIESYVGRESNRRRGERSSYYGTFSTGSAAPDVSVSNADASLIGQSVSFIVRIKSPGDAEVHLQDTLADIVDGLVADGYPIDSLTARDVLGTGSAFTPVLDLSRIKLGSKSGSSSRIRPAARGAKSGKDVEEEGDEDETSALLHHSSSPPPPPPAFSLHSLWAPREAVRERREALRKRKQWERHREICQACSGEADGPEQTDRSTSQKAAHDIRLLIGGMTCSSCVANVEKSVQSLVEDGLIAEPGLRVDLISKTGRATGFADGDEGRSLLKAKLVEAVEDAGYEVESFEAMLKADEPTNSTKGTSQASGSRFKAKFSIGGMTCASCVSAIDGSVQRWSESRDDAGPALLSFEVDLLSNSASARWQAGAHQGHADVEKVAREVAEAIEDSGYDCQLALVEEDAQQSSRQAVAPERTVSIQVDGMFCTQCVRKVRSEVRSWQSRHKGGLKASGLDAFSMDQPVFQITYTPVPQQDDPLTMRHLIAAISTLDDTWTVSHVKPPSLAARSRELAWNELVSQMVRLLIAALFAVPTTFIGMIVPMFLPQDGAVYQAIARPLVGTASTGDIILWCLATPVQFGVGSVFYVGAWKSIRRVWRKGRSWSDRLLRWGNMDVLVAFGTTIAYAASVGAVLVEMAQPAPRPEDAAQMSMSFFDACIFLNFFILLGRVLESWSKRRTGDAVAQLGSLKPTRALLRNDGEQTEIDVDLLEVGDKVLIPLGASPPLDCILVDGDNDQKASFNESSLTGEDRPVTKQAEDKVYAGTANAGSRAVIARVNVLPDECMIDGILEAVREASGRKAGIQRLADRVTSYFVPVIVYLSALVLVIWLILLYAVLSDDWIKRHVHQSEAPGARALFALQFAVSCLVIACPCGIGLAAPTAQMVGIGLSSKHGILVNGGGEAFSVASQVKLRRRPLTVLSDKTGTITMGEGAQVVDHVFATTAALSDSTLCRLMSEAEESSTHPIAVALRTFGKDRASSSAPDSTASLVDTTEVSGKGITADLSGGQVAKLFLGNRSLLKDAGLDFQHHDSIEILSRADEWLDRGSIVIFAAIAPKDAGARLAAAFAIADAVRPEAIETFANLRREYDAQIWMLTGDNKTTAEAVAKDVGISRNRVRAHVSPEGKRDCIETLREQAQIHGKQPHQRLLLFIGDGINDSPALAAADVAVAMGGGSTIAHSSADFILLNKSAPLRSIETILSLSAATTVKIYSNFAWAAVFNVVLVPIAAGILEPIGISIGPSLSGLAMALSSTSVVLNALTLNFWKPPNTAKT